MVLCPSSRSFISSRSASGISVRCPSFPSKPSFGCVKISLPRRADVLSMRFRPWA